VQRSHLVDQRGLEGVESRRRLLHVVALTRSAAQAYGLKGVRVNALVRVGSTRR
jgi:hypothetical protein